MNRIVIFFVPPGAPQQEFEAALREYFPLLDSDRNSKPPAESDPCSAEELPFWTWFLPNPLPAPKNSRAT